MSIVVANIALLNALKICIDTDINFYTIIAKLTMTINTLQSKCNRFRCNIFLFHTTVSLDQVFGMLYQLYPIQKKYCVHYYLKYYNKISKIDKYSLILCHNNKIFQAEMFFLLKQKFESCVVLLDFCHKYDIANCKLIRFF